MHSWFTYCVDPEAFQNARSLKDFIGYLRKQSNDPSALVPYRETNRFLDYDDEGDLTSKILAPRYFGAGFEAFAETFLQVFGHEFNLADVASLDSDDQDIEDTGYDITAVTAKKKTYKGMIIKQAQTGSPVFCQAKATLNPTKEFTTNDGSRIMNFYGNAQGMARMQGCAYQARYLLITSGKGLHYKLDQNTQKDIEVINFSKIDRMVKDNPIFWNPFRENLGLAVLQFQFRQDPEFECIVQQTTVQKKG